MKTRKSFLLPTQREALTKELFLGWLTSLGDRVMNFRIEGQRCLTCPVAMFLKEVLKDPDAGFNGTSAFTDKDQWSRFYDDGELSTFFHQVAAWSDKAKPMPASEFLLVVRNF